MKASTLKAISVWAVIRTFILSTVFAAGKLWSKSKDTEDDLVQLVQVVQQMVLVQQTHETRIALNESKTEDIKDDIQEIKENIREIRKAVTNDQ